MKPYNANLKVRMFLSNIEHNALAVFNKGFAQLRM